jgi:hypothetical protein
MGLPANLLKLKLRAQLGEDRRLIVTHDLQAAALRRTVQRKSGNDDCTSGCIGQV